MTTTPVTVDCTQGTTNSCADVKASDNSTAICAEINTGSSSSATNCECEADYGASTSPYGKACTKSGLTC